MIGVLDASIVADEVRKAHAFPRRPRLQCRMVVPDRLGESAPILRGAMTPSSGQCDSGAGGGTNRQLSREQFLGSLEALPAERYSHTPLLGRIWELRHNFTAYDAAYIALAEATGSVL
jgi:hypothetical protein